MLHIRIRLKLAIMGLNLHFRFVFVVYSTCLLLKRITEVKA